MNAVIRALTFMLIFSFPASAQTWIQPGATWHYDWETVSGVGFVKLVYSADVTIDGKTAHRLDHYRYDWWTKKTETLDAYYVYKSNDSIYYWTADGFKLFYDFGAKPGDVWTLGYNASFGCDTSKVIVDSIGTIELNGTTYRWISLSRLNGSFWGLEGKIVERFGAMEGYFFPTERACDTNIFDFGTIYYFNCFEDDSFGLYNPTSKSCEHWKETGVYEDNPLTNAVRIYPNPATEKLHIQLTEPNGTYQVQIFDATGKKFTNRSIGSGEEVLGISALPKGIYIVRVIDEKGNFYSQKIIKM